MFIKFGEWLVDQQYRDDLIGDLARLPIMQNSDPKSSGRKRNEHNNWADIVIEIPQPGYILVFNDAWQEFLLAKQAAADSLDQFRFLKNGRSKINYPPHRHAPTNLPQLAE